MKKGIDFTGIAVVFWCHDGKGNILFEKRSKNCRDEHGAWNPGAGSLEFGESVIDALKREIKEEFCTEVLDYEFLGYRDGVRKKEGKDSHWVALDFKVLVDRSKVKKGEPHKQEELGWFKSDNLPTPRHSQFENYWSLYKDKLSN